MVPFSILDSSLGTFALPNCDEFNAARVVVCTCVMASVVKGLMYAGNPLENGLLGFSHLLIDEAGQVGRDVIATRMSVYFIYLLSLFSAVTYIYLL